MQKLIYYVAASLDGFIAGEDGSFSDFIMDDEIVAHFMESLEQFGAVLMGRKTYEVGLAEGKTNPYPMLESHVVSRSMEQKDYPEVNIMASNIEETVRKIKASAEKPVWLCGGGEIAGQLCNDGLIDEIWIKLNPIVLGKGIALFGGRTIPGGLALMDQQVLKSGVVVLKYKAIREYNYLVN